MYFDCNVKCALSYSTMLRLRTSYLLQQYYIINKYIYIYTDRCTNCRQRVVGMFTASNRRNVSAYSHNVFCSISHERWLYLSSTFPLGSFSMVPINWPHAFPFARLTFKTSNSFLSSAACSWAQVRSGSTYDHQHKKNTRCFLEVILGTF